MQNQRDDLGLKAGDKAYFLLGEYGEVVSVTIIEECEEGRGYSAISPYFAKEHPDSKGHVHTCNGFLTVSRKAARLESLRRMKKARTRFAKEQAHCSKWIQFLDYWVARGGRKSEI